MSAGADAPGAVRRDIPTVALVGRPNVGKSTLFNRLTRTRDALVADYPGLTRDRQYGTGRVGGWPYVLVDTGGLSGEPETLDAAMASQTQAAVDEADLVIFLVDARDGLVEADREIAERLRRVGAPVLLAVNKADGVGDERAALEFHELGFDPVVAVSAAHNRGVRALVDLAADALEVPAEAREAGSGEDASRRMRKNPRKGWPGKRDGGVAGVRGAGGTGSDGAAHRAGPGDGGVEGGAAPDPGTRGAGDADELADGPADESADGGDPIGRAGADPAHDADAPPDPMRREDGPPTIGFVGRPNVGKSTLVNRLLGEERVIAYDRPGTTRDTVAIPFERGGREYTLVDTAGVRRRGKIAGEKIEVFTVIKTLQAIERANVCVLLLDAADGLTEQDLSLLSFVIDKGRALVVAVNKWDSVSSEDRDALRETLERRVEFLSFTRIHFISALRGSGVDDLFRSIDRAHRSAFVRMATPRLTRLLELAVEQHPPPMHAGRRIKLLYAHQGGVNPPIVIVHGRQADKLPGSYVRYLTGHFMKAMRLFGTPLRLEFRQGKNPFAGKAAGRVGAKAGHRDPGGGAGKGPKGRSGDKGAAGRVGAGVAPRSGRGGGRGR